MSSRPVPKGPENFTMRKRSMRKSGGFLAGRIPRCRPRAGPQRTARRAATGLWRVRGRAERYQELRKRLAAAARGERAAGGALGPLPGQVHLVDSAPGEAQLRVGQQHEPGPAVGLRGMADPGRGPVERLLAEAVGVLQIE